MKLRKTSTEFRCRKNLHKVQKKNNKKSRLKQRVNQNVEQTVFRTSTTSSGGSDKNGRKESSFRKERTFIFNPHTSSHGSNNILNSSTISSDDSNYLATFEDEENKLADQLKSICDNKYKELNPKLSSKLLYKIGLIYIHKQPVQISLIKCAGLLNAALARKPENAEQIQNTLKELCSFILFTADAAQKHANLFEFSGYVEYLFEKLRKDVSKELRLIMQVTEQLNQRVIKQQEQTKIDQIKFIQEYITDFYKQSMATISQYCETVMGQPKCKYAVIGLGSIARKEITPYSDFEHMILLEDGVQNRDDYETILNYFRWFSNIFHVILINLQETIVPNLAVKSLNYQTLYNYEWFYDGVTTRGVSFDGMNAGACKFPLGNQHHTEEPLKYELIKPVNEMLNYVKDASYSNHFKDILLTTCFVYGSQDVYKSYENGIKKHIKEISEDKEMLKLREKQLEKDFFNFGTRNKLADLEQMSRFNVKKIIYRSTTLFISHLAKINNISSTSCFEILDELADTKVISEYARHKLSYAVAIACEIRLKVYIEKQSQEEFVQNVDINDKDKTSFKECVGEKSLLSYFRIAYSLQCLITLKHFYEIPFLLNISICWFFNLENEYRFMLEKLELYFSVHLCYNGFDECLGYLESELSFMNRTDDFNRIIQKFSKIEETNVKFWERLYKLTSRFYSLDMFLVAIEYGRRFLSKVPSNSDQTLNIVLVHRIVGDSLMSLNKYHEAEIELIKSLDLNQRSELVEIATISVFSVIGKKLKQSSPSESDFVHSCLNAFNSKNYGIKNFLMRFLKLNMYKCLNYVSGHSCANVVGSKLEEKSNRQSEKLLNATKNIPLAQFKIGVCLFKQKRLIDSKEYLTLCIESEHVENDVIIDALTFMGNILWEETKYKEALCYYEKSARKQLSESESTHDAKKYSEVYVENKAVILSHMKKHKDSLAYLESLLTFQTEIKESTRNLIVTEVNIAIRLIRLGRPSNAMNKLKRLLDQAKDILLYLDEDPLIAGIYEQLGKCYSDVNRKEEAINYSEKALNTLIKSSISNNRFKNKIDLLINIGVLYNNIGANKSQLKIISVDEVVVYLKKSLQYFSNALDAIDSLTFTEQHNEDISTQSLEELEKIQMSKIQILKKQPLLDLITTTKSNLSNCLSLSS